MLSIWVMSYGRNKGRDYVNWLNHETYLTIIWPWGFPSLYPPIVKAGSRTCHVWLPEGIHKIRGHYQQFNVHPTKHGDVREPNHGYLWRIAKLFVWSMPYTQSASWLVVLSPCSSDMWWFRSCPVEKLGDLATGFLWTVGILKFMR